MGWAQVWEVWHSSQLSGGLCRTVMVRFCLGSLQGIGIVVFCQPPSVLSGFNTIPWRVRLVSALSPVPAITLCLDGVVCW